MSLDRETLNTLLLYGITGAGAVITATWLALIMWTWRDMRLRSRDPLAQIAASLVVAALGIPGVVIYVMLRPQETLSEAYERSLEEEALLQNIEEKPVCAGCGRPIKDNWQVCPYCHTKLKKSCTACGKLLELPWNLCPYCTTSQVPAEQAQAGRRAAQQRSAPRQAKQAPPPDYTPDESFDSIEYIEDDHYNS